MSWARILAALFLWMTADLSFAQEPTVPAETLFEQAQNDAANPLRLDLLMNLAQSQLRFRVESNFHGYEADEEFSKNSLTNFATAFANLSVLDRLQTVDFKDFVIAYEQERGKYGAFLQQYSEALGVEPNTEWSNLNARAMALLALLTKAYRPPDDRQYSDESWIWPFCQRK